MTKVYNKLVRDKIPQIIEKAGKKPVTFIIEDNEQLRRLLIEKLREEVEEYCTTLEHEELADILEVIYSLAESVHGITFSDIEKVRTEKEKERGGFRERIFLEKVIE